MKNVVAELFVKDLSDEKKEEFINTYFDLVESSKGIIKIIEDEERLLIVEDDSNFPC